MCLSAVYEQRPEGEHLLCRNVANVQIAPEALTFTDLLGVRTVYQGRLLRLDLMENKILVETAQP